VYRLSVNNTKGKCIGDMYNVDIKICVLFDDNIVVILMRIFYTLRSTRFSIKIC
jgi:hypothetical protein